MNIIQKLKQKHAARLEKVNYKEKEHFNANVYLFQRWGWKVGKNWYGFDGIPSMVWADIINDFLIELEKDCPNFEIHQVKLKYGSLRFYADLNTQHADKIEKWDKNIEELEEWLYHKDLVY